MNRGMRNSHLQDEEMSRVPDSKTYRGPPSVKIISSMSKQTITPHQPQYPGRTCK